MESRRQKWARLCEELRQSGMTKRQFAAERDLNLNTLTWWCWKLGAESRAADKPAPIFAPVRIVAPARQPKAPTTTPIHLELPNGIALRFDHSDRPEDIAHLVAALGRL